MNLGVAELRRLALGVTGLLVLVVLWGAGRVLFLSPPEPHLPAASSLNVVGVMGADAGEQLPPDFTARPLFFYGRRPYEPPEQEEEVVELVEEVPEMEIDEVRLVGVLGAGDQSGIIVSHAGSSRRLKLDDEIEGWRFVGLAEGGAEFTSLGRTRVLTMEHAAPRAAGRKKAKSRAEKSGKKDNKKDDEKAKEEERAKKRAERREESRSRESGRRDRRSPGMTSVWGGPPKKAEPEKEDDKKPAE